MQKYLIIFSILIGLLFSCQKKDKVSNSTNQNTTSKDTLKHNLKNHSFYSRVRLTNEGKKYIKNWDNYFNLNNHLNNYKQIDYKTSLFHSQELAVLAQQLKDSLKIEKINNSSFRSRLNTIHSISLRLADMDSIPAITQKEVLIETTNLFNAFDGLTIKINSLAKKTKLEDDLKEFDFLFSKKDSIDDTKTDKKVINKTKRPRKIERIKPIKNKLNEKKSVILN